MPNKLYWRIIYEYFNDLQHLIKYIIIDDDTNIQLIGNLEGIICNTKTPIIGWKRYWYGKYKIIDYIYNNEDNKHKITINTRFDLFNNSYNFSLDTIMFFISNRIELIFRFE